MILDLNACFPPAADGTQRPLPKQQQFLDAVFNPGGPKFIAYVGGVGSGKTLIGCIAMIYLAIAYPGDYLIARQFMPELSITTYKTFKELCPKEVIVEDRIADRIIRIRGAGGKISNVIFRQLDEVDKLRSLNLCAVYIDEASQVSEAAFLLLQGRLRGPHIRKLILTSNPAGHDWIYRWWVKQDGFKTEEAKARFSLIKAPSTENVHLPDGYVQSMLETYSPERIQREIMGSFDAFEGQVYHEFRRDVHVIKPFVIPKEWSRVVGMDHGYRNPACALWGAIDYDDNIYIYREFYEREWLIKEICKGHDKTKAPGIVAMSGTDKIDQARIDPSTRNRDGKDGQSDWDEYLKHLPASWPLLPANNDKELGIDRVKSYLKVSEKTGKPRLYVFDTCVNVIEEMAKYKYKELTHTQQGKMNEKEEPVKVDDHAMDALRYLCMSQPEAPKHEDRRKHLLQEQSLEGSMRRELDALKHPKVKDPFQDF